MRSFKFHPQAVDDLASAATYYERESMAVAQRFAGEMDRLISEICANPGIYRRVHGRARRHISTRFPFRVIYVDKSDYLLIVAISHFKRRSSYWFDRIRDA